MARTPKPDGTQPKESGKPVKRKKKRRWFEKSDEEQTVVPIKKPTRHPKNHQGGWLS